MSDLLELTAAANTGNSLMGPGAAGGGPRDTLPESTMQQGGLSVEAFNTQVDSLINQLSGEAKTELFEVAKGKIKGNPEICKQIVPQGSYSGSVGTGSKLNFFYINSKDFGIVQNADDKYSHFYFIQNSLHDQFKNMVHNIGVFKDFRSTYKSTTEGLRQYYYLFHCLFSKAMPVTVLQYACMWNALDELKLILSYLVGTSPEYAKKYINYCIKDGDLKGMRAIDLIGELSKASLGAKSTVKQFSSFLGNTAKNVFNPATAIYNIGKGFANTAARTASRLGTITGVTNDPIEALLLQYGSKPKGSDPEGDDQVEIIEVAKDAQYGPNDPYYAISYPNIKKYKEGASLQQLRGGMTGTRKFRRANKVKKQRGKTARR